MLWQLYIACFKLYVSVLSCALSSELRELVKMHGTHEKSNEEPLSYDEVLIVKVSSTKIFYSLG